MPEHPTTRRKPPWLRKKVPLGQPHGAVRRILKADALVTVCEEAQCPNRHECWGESGTATFMVGGHICTRACRYCSVQPGRPGPLDPSEPERLADAAREMNLKHVVITAVNRDDLPDGGAEHMAACIRAVRERCPGASLETLIPDYDGNWDACRVVFEARPEVLNHNIELAKRLFPRIRPRGDYQRSLDLLKLAFEEMPPDTVIKSGFMVGIGETREEVTEVLRDLRTHHVQAVTVGQYLKPAGKKGLLEVDRWVTPEEFQGIEKEALAMGFESVFAGPFVRSSYHAGKVYLRSQQGE